MSVLDHNEDELTAILKEALARPLDKNFSVYISQSADQIRKGYRGGEPWALDLIKLLALAIAESRNPKPNSKEQSWPRDRQ